MHSMLPDETLEVVKHCLGKTCSSLALDRTEEIKRWIYMSSVHAAAERKLKGHMSIRRREVLKGKKLVLLEMLMRDAGHDDHDLVMNVTEGFDLTGVLTESHVFARRAPQTETASVYTVDHIAAPFFCVMRFSEAAGVKTSLVAKTWDLADAYKQVPWWFTRQKNAGLKFFNRRCYHSVQWHW